MTTIVVSVAAVGLFLFGAALCWLAWQVASARPHAAVEDETTDPDIVDDVHSGKPVNGWLAQVHNRCFVNYHAGRFDEAECCSPCFDLIGKVSA